MIELLFKKYFWSVTGATTGALALILALTASAWLEGRIRATVPYEILIPAAAEGADPTGTLRAESEGLAGVLADRRIFNAEPPPMPEEPDEDDLELADGGGENGEGEDEEEIPLTDLDVNLMGTMVSPDPAWSLATIKASGESKLVREGMEVGDGAFIKEISRTYVVLGRKDNSELVRLWAEKPSGGSGPGRAGSRFDRNKTQRPSYRPGQKSNTKSSPARPGRSPSKSSTDYDKGVAKVGEWEYKLDRNMLENELNDLTRLGMQARVVPNYVGGKYQGFKLVGVRPNSLYRAIGLRSGDIIKRVNGSEIDSPNKALQLFEKLRTSRRIALDIKRAGMARTLNYRIQ